jgi:hypothetical protein
MSIEFVLILLVVYNLIIMKRKKINLLILVLLFIVSITSCVDTWDSHYSPISIEKSNLNLYKYISQDTALSTFTKMLKISGYDSVLNRTQTYTVWAPVNSAIVGISLANTALVKEIVKNHISRFSNPTSDVNTKSVFMIDNKYILFTRVGSNFTFGGKNIIKSNIATTNGILHYIDNYVPYTPNIWEYIGKTVGGPNGLDSLKAYLYSQTKLQFDVTASGSPIGTDSATNQPLYDSVFVYKNLILDKLGQLGNEDSLYTAILPTNTAWTEVYNRINPDFKTLPKDGGVQKQRENTQWAIVQDIAFRQRVSNPTSLDSVTSTSGNVFHNTSGNNIFSGTTKTELSNGNAFVTNLMTQKPEESWQKTIRIEAETETYGRDKSNCDIYNRSSAGSGLSISQDKYIYVNNTTTNNSSRCYVRFPIPNTLSAKYNIYCVLVPGSIVDSTDKRLNKVRFYLSYVNSAGVQIASASIDANNVAQQQTTPKSFGKIFETTTFTEPQKMFITQFDFSYCNIIDPLTFKPTDITVKVWVENVANTSETVKYNRDMRIDCILLEPAQ